MVGGGGELDQSLCLVLGTISASLPSPGTPEPAAPTTLPLVGSQQRPRRRAQAVVPWEHECQLRSLALRVKDLGLGYASEETMLFKYCSGGCPSTRSNHDLALARLSLKGWDLPTQGEGKLPGGPCCRPTRYEDAAFLDDGHRWHEVRELSAAACGCVG